MPAVSEKQRRFLAAELRRKRAGKRTKTDMSLKQLSEFAGSVRKRPEMHAEMMKGTPPMEGFVRPEKGYKHLGRFATGKPRKEYPRP